MRRPTLAQAMAQGIGKPVGVCAGDIEGNAAIVNMATEQLMYDPLAPDEGWLGGWIKMLFNVNSSLGSSFITTPHDIARVIVMDVCKNPIPIRNEFYEYLEFGIGLQPKGCNAQVCQPNTVQAFERGNVATLADFLPTPQFLRAFPTDNADVGRRIVFQGPDQNGVPVTGIDAQTQTSVSGETDYLVVPFVTSVSQFAGITGILKEVTVGRVLIYMIDPVTQASTYLTTMEPGETTAVYRRYFLNGLPCNCCATPGGVVQVSALCKIDYVPVFSPQDYLGIPNIPALFEQVQSIRYSRMDSEIAAKLEAKHHSRAIALLNGQLDHVLGKIKTAITVPLFGSDRLRPQPI